MKAWRGYVRGCMGQFHGCLGSGRGIEKRLGSSVGLLP